MVELLLICGCNVVVALWLKMVGTWLKCGCIAVELRLDGCRTVVGLWLHGGWIVHGWNL